MPKLFKKDAAGLFLYFDSEANEGYFFTSHAQQHKSHSFLLLLLPTLHGRCNCHYQLGCTRAQVHGQNKNNNGLFLSCIF